MVEVTYPYLVLSCVLGTIVLLVILEYQLYFIGSVIKSLIKRKGHKDRAEELSGKECPFFISRVYFHTYNKSLTFWEKVLCVMFPYWYMGHHCRQIETLFRGGYCWYFAHMLRLAFNRGTVCWAAPHSHFVWEDTDGTRWDISGRVRESEYSFFIPETYLPDEMLFIFKQANYLGHECKKFTVDEYLEVIDAYVRDHPVDYNKGFVGEMLDTYLINKCSKNRDDIKEKTFAV